MSTREQREGTSIGNLFTGKHHGGHGDGQWLASLSEEDEFAVFDAADEMELSDADGNLFGALSDGDASLRMLGNHEKQIAMFPCAAEGSPWHGYPRWALNEHRSMIRPGVATRLSLPVLPVPPVVLFVLDDAMETLIACLTPPGKAAIATLAVRGPLGWPITRDLFKPHKGALPDEPRAGCFWFGKLGQAQADDAILAVKADALELHCHGGVEIVRMLQELYRERGVVIVPWQQFSADPSMQILDLLAQAPTARTAAILLDQANGAWDRCVNEIEASGDPELATRKLARLQALIPLGTHLVEPWKIVIGGAPNVGKSSLMNALAGYCRSVVSPVPGTTRDIVTTRLAIDGWPVELIDTAGMREASSPLEQQGIARAEAAAQAADLRFWLVDGSAAPVYPVDRSRWSVIVNKIDLPAGWDWRLAEPALRISAQTHVGLAELCAMIALSLVPEPPGPGEALPCLPEQVDWIRAIV